MRFDSIGLWWEDAAAIKIPKAPKPKRTPPEPVWLRPDYLPNLAEAQACRFDILSNRELKESALRRDLFSMDVESYANYMLVGFRRLKDKKIVYFEQVELNGLTIKALDLPKMKWCLENLQFVTFNGMSFDVPWCQIALLGHDCEAMHAVTQMLIKNRDDPSFIPHYMVVKKFKGVKLSCDHIDLIEVAPGTMDSLKTYGGRIHAKRLQDLPFHPMSLLSLEQMCILRWYWNNDLDTTEGLYWAIKSEIDERIELGKNFDLDLRSKSDAQIAEAILGKLCAKDRGMQRLPKARVEPGKTFQYKPPAFIKFRSKELKKVLHDLTTAVFEIDLNGYVIAPEALEGPPRIKKTDKRGRKVVINNTTYVMGIGGLHSMDEHMHFVSGHGYQLHDWDVTGYYPNLMINAGLYPESCGPSFLIHFERIKIDREVAKAAGNKKKAQTYKIITNGTFGKTGSPYSIFYAPELMIQTTVTGQLMLLMLVERMEWAGIPCVSGNTDGVVIKCPDGRDADMRAIIKQWEDDTRFNMEETKYRAIYSSDVNTYIAVYQNPKDDEFAKTKGRLGLTSLSKNPTAQIVADAAVAKLVHGTPIEQTIRMCKDVRKFIHLRSVKGGGVKDGEYLGKVVRWYVSANETGEIIYAKSGNKVAKSDKAKPLMLLPDELPDDIDYDWHIQECEKVLTAIGYN